MPRHRYGAHNLSHLQPLISKLPLSLSFCSFCLSPSGAALYDEFSTYSTVTDFASGLAGLVLTSHPPRVRHIITQVGGCQGNEFKQSGREVPERREFSMTGWRLRESESVARVLSEMTICRRVRVLLDVGTLFSIG